MSDIKTVFREWLQKNFSKSTASSYYSLVQKIFDKNFGIRQDWQRHSENIMPLLARYFEFANREYKLDRITIWYALDYFDNILKFIYPKQNKTYNYEPDVKISIYDGKKDYPIIDASLYNLNNYIKYIANHIFKQHHKLNTESINTLKTLVTFPDISEKIKPIDIKDVAIHIDYKESSNSAEKNALSQYCNFLYSVTDNSVFNYMINPIVNMVATSSPRSYICGFIEIEPITGKHARKVKPNPGVKRYTNIGYVYSTEDLANIFNIDFNTVSNLMTKYGINNKITTSCDGYYNADITHDILKRHHHYKDKVVDNIYSDVDYTKIGYEQWETRKGAMKRLGIKKSAFYTHVSERCLYIDYAEGAPKYYIPELEYFKNLDIIKQISKRKYHKNILLNKNRTLSKKTCNL